MKGRPFKKGSPPGPGRPKGRKNKYTSLKAAFLLAFVELDGVEGLVRWARKHRTQYYSLLARLLPASMEGDFNLKIQKTPDELSDAELEAIAKGSERENSGDVQ